MGFDPKGVDIKNRKVILK